MSRELSPLGVFMLNRASDLGMTTEGQLVRRSGLRAGTVNRLLYGEAKLTPETLDQLAAALDVPVTDLIAAQSGGE